MRHASFSNFPPGRRPLWPLQAGGRIPTSDFYSFPIPNSGYGQSFEGQKNDPPVSLASFQNALAAKGSPSMGYRIILTGIREGSRRMASLNRLRRFLPETLFPQGFLAPMVGRLSDSRKILSGAGFISAMTLKAFSRLVPFSGTSLRMPATV